MMTENSTEIGKSGEFPINKLFLELMKLHHEMETAEGDDFDRLHTRSWEIRAQVSATSAMTRKDQIAKARVYQIEAERDPLFECDAPGSARDLSNSLAADTIRFLAAETIREKAEESAEREWEAQCKRRDAKGRQ